MLPGEIGRVGSKRSDGGEHPGARILPLGLIDETVHGLPNKVGHRTPALRRKAFEFAGLVRGELNLRANHGEMLSLGQFVITRRPPEEAP
jgi:hypothetical protein